jgi:large repetitive protein
VYQGVVSGNQVTFYGVPVIPPGLNGPSSARILRITNLRLSGLGFLPISMGQSPVQATITASNYFTLPLDQSSILVGVARSGLTTALAGPTAFQRCNAQTLSQSAVLTFSEEFAGSFKTRVDPTVTGQINGQGNALVQDEPGRIYSSESWFTLSGLYGTGTAGLADFGTRLTAVFRNIPEGVSVFVSQFGVTLNSSGTATGEVSSGSSWVQAVSSETAPDGAGTIPAAPVYGMLAPGGNGNIHVVELTRQSDGTALASWESIANTPTAIDTYNFAVFISYPAHLAGVGTARVSLRFGPESGGSTDTVPRFFDVPTEENVISIGACQQ